jgi:hypothetical protein
VPRRLHRPPIVVDKRTLMGFSARLTGLCCHSSVRESNALGCGSYQDMDREQAAEGQVGDRADGQVGSYGGQGIISFCFIAITSLKVSL